METVDVEHFHLPSYEVPRTMSSHTYLDLPVEGLVLLVQPDAHVDIPRNALYMMGMG